MLKHTMKILLAASITFTAVSFAAGSITTKSPKPPSRLPAGNNGAAFSLNTPFTCGPGFSKKGEHRNSNQWLDWYVCGTQKITCPAQLQSNGHYSDVTPTAIIQQVNNPDAAAKSFTVQYKCDYTFVHYEP